MTAIQAKSRRALAAAKYRMLAIVTEVTSAMSAEVAEEALSLDDEERLAEVADWRRRVCLRSRRRRGRSRLA